MRILQYCTDFPTGGIQTHVMDLSAWLAGQGHEVSLAGEPENAVSEVADYRFIPLSMWKISREDGNIAGRLIALARIAWKLRGHLKNNPVDIIHVHETAPAITAWLATRGLGIPIIMTFHGSAPERVRQAAKIARRCADLTVSPSRITLDTLIAHGVEVDKARQLGLGIKHQPEPDPTLIAELRKKYLPDGNGTLIFSPSRLDRQKGIDIMIDVAAVVRTEYPDTVFVIAGGGPLTGTVEEWAKAKGQAEAMHFLGPITTVPSHLAASDIFLLTSRWEALPISIVEAFRAARPVIATDCGGVSELVDDAVGSLETVEDTTALAEAVIKLIRNPEVRAQKGDAALERSQEDRFDPEKVHKSFEKTYLDLVQKHG